jgi:hypothetical protein
MNSLQPSGLRILFVASSVATRLLLAVALALLYCVLEHDGRGVTASTSSKPKQETFHGKEVPKGNRE